MEFNEKKYFLSKYIIFSLNIAFVEKRYKIRAPKKTLQNSRALDRSRIDLESILDRSRIDLGSI